jgi:hypothetical protein
MHCSSFKFTSAVNSLLIFFSLLVISSFSLYQEFTISSICSSSKTARLLDALQLLMLFGGRLKYLEQKLFLLLVFRVGAVLII